MKFQVFCRKAVSLVLAAALGLGLSATASAREYNDYEEIVSHVSLKVPGKLNIARPADDITTSASNYFIMGSSDPDVKLTMNGEEVKNRGARGSFGVYVALDKGENTFKFKQGAKSATVTIIRGQVTDAPTTKVISSMAPSYDCATVSGETIRLSCVAPSGATVVATVGGRQVKLKQAAATAKKGVPATFTGETVAGQVRGTRDLGPVTYTLNGSQTFTSAGKVFLAGELGSLAVQVKNNVANVYKDSQRSAYIETAKLGAVDVVVDITSTMYKLSTGGWVMKESVQPLTRVQDVTLDVDEISFGVEDDGKGEMLTLSGGGKPMFRAYMDSETLNVKLFNTAISQNQAAALDDAIGRRSYLFTGVELDYEGQDAILTFPLAGEKGLWGYDVSYGADGGVNIYAKYQPRLSDGDKPLSGVTIAVDAGHGGADPGALGIPLTSGATEKDITLATAIAVQKRLESLGADVVMCRTDDSDVTMNQRMTDTFAARADLFISLHCNSIGYDTDASKPNGTEVYYFENIAKKLATALSANVSEYTGRTNRGAKFSNYRVTLNSYAPSVLVEMGFLTNPAEYDSMTSRRGIYNTANAVGDSVLAALK